MKVRLERRWEYDAVDVYVYELGSPTSRARILRFLTDDDGRPLLRWDEFNVEEVQTAPSVSLPREVLEQIVAQAGDFLPPSAATDVALKDARETRDRLLTLVEVTTHSLTRRAR